MLLLCVWLQVKSFILAPGYLSVPGIRWVLLHLSQGKYNLLTFNAHHVAAIDRSSWGYVCVRG
jgi:hypothetical protein